MIITLQEYLKYKYINNIDFNESIFNLYPYYIITKYLDLDNKQIIHIFHGLNLKRNIIYSVHINNVPLNYLCWRYNFFCKLNNILYISYLQSECSNLSVFKCVNIDGEYKRIYPRRYNFSVLPSIKYVLKKLERDPDFLQPLITTSLTAFYEFYQQFYNKIVKLKQVLNIR